MFTQTHRRTPTIVVGIDGSATAMEALQRAAELARQRGGELHVVHSYRHASRREARLDEARRAQPSVQQNLDLSLQADVCTPGDSYTAALALLDHAASLVETPTLTVHLHAVNADAHRALRWAAEEHQAELIVVAQSPAASWLHPRRKSVQELLASTTTCPVQVVGSSADRDLDREIRYDRRASVLGA